MQTQVSEDEPLKCTKTINCSNVWRSLSMDDRTGLFAALVGCDYVKSFFRYARTRDSPYRVIHDEGDPERFTLATRTLRQFSHTMQDHKVVTLLASMIIDKEDRATWQKGALQALQFYRAPPSCELIRSAGGGMEVQSYTGVVAQYFCHQSYYLPTSGCNNAYTRHFLACSFKFWEYLQQETTNVYFFGQICSLRAVL